jgi:hypothetical protein
MDVDDFDFSRFLDKCTKYGHKFLSDNMTVTQYKLAIEDIYNYKSQNKTSLKYKYGK